MTATKEMEDFFKTVGEVRGLIEKLSCQAEDVDRRQATILTSPSQDMRSKDELELLNNESKKNAKFVRAALKSIQKPGDETGATVIQRIRKNQHSYLTRWFAEVMRGYHEAQISFREKCKAQIQRQLEIVNKNTTDQELEEMLQHDNLTVFISDITCNSEISSQALTEIELRHQEILCLESSIKELHEIFVDAAMLLEVQGDLINNIERNVSNAAEYVEKSVEETGKAVACKKNPYKIAFRPNFLKNFKRNGASKTAADQNTSDLNHNWAPDPV